MKNVTFENCVLLPIQSADPKVQANLNKLHEEILGMAAAHDMKLWGEVSKKGFSITIPWRRNFQAVYMAAKSDWQLDCAVLMRCDLALWQGRRVWDGTESDERDN
jgi:hypothetical protein